MDRRRSNHSRGWTELGNHLHGRSRPGAGPSQTASSNTKFVLPMEPTESVDQYQEYPPIVTADGDVDTDIDHLMVNPEDDYVDLPVLDIPNKFPKPRVVTVIEGSLDDDIDNLMNHDGTMTHSLLETPKNFQPGDLKEINASKEVKKHHRQYRRMEEDQVEEGMIVKSYELVPAREQNNSSEKYPEDDMNFAKTDAEVKFSLAEQDKPSEVPASEGENKWVSNDCKQVYPACDGTGEPLPKITTSKTEKGEDVLSNVKSEDGETIHQDRTEVSGKEKEEKKNEDVCFEESNQDEGKEEGGKQSQTEAEEESESPNLAVDVEIIENLTIMCSDAITKLAQAEKGMGHLEQQHQLLAIANVLKQRIPEEKRNTRFTLNPNRLSGQDGQGGMACLDSADLNVQAKELIQNLIQQVTVIEHAGTVSSQEGKGNARGGKVDDLEDQPREQRSSRDTGLKESNCSPAQATDDNLSLHVTAHDSSHCSRASDNPDVSISAALKVAGDSMTAAARMAEALSLLIKTTSKPPVAAESSKKSGRLKDLKEHRVKYPRGKYQMYGGVDLPQFDMGPVKPGRLPKEEDVSSLDDIGSRALHRPVDLKRRRSILYESADFRDCLGKMPKEEFCEDYLERHKRQERKRRSNSMKDDSSRRGDLQGMPFSKSHHRRRSEIRGSECTDLSSKDESVLGTFRKSHETFDQFYSRDRKRKSSPPKEKYECLDHPTEKGATSFPVSGLEEARQVLRKSRRPRKSHAKSDKDTEKKHSSHHGSPSRLKEGDEIVRKTHRHKRVPSAEIDVTEALRKHGESGGRRKRSSSLRLDDHKSRGKTAKSKPSHAEKDGDAGSNVDLGFPLFTETAKGVAKEPAEAKSSATIDETWSLPTRCTSPCDTYFDRVVRSLKTWAPHREPVPENKATNYIRTKLVGSVVDPNTRDSDFDSIEFNGNAHVSFSSLVEWQYDDGWRGDEECDSSVSEYECYSPRWHYDY